MSLARWILYTPQPEVQDSPQLYLEEKKGARLVITYTSSLDDINPELLQGFFVGWPNGPTPETHFKILQRSDHIVLACEEIGGPVVGFITAITDGVLSAFIPHLEVLPPYKGQGIGSELVRRMLDQLHDFYAIDLICDAEVQPFYERLGLRPYTAMLLRNFARQSGE